MELLGESLSGSTVLWLVFTLGLALSFEFVNGFHDAANAVATVIYTHSLPPTLAVVWSGLWNLLGALTSTGAVAFSILALLPGELILNASSAGSTNGLAMILALLTAAILWNLGTWYLGLPASSSHTLVGAIVGVGLAQSALEHRFGVGVNWVKAEEVLASLLLSPLLGFGLAALLLWITQQVIQQPELYAVPQEQQPPPPWIRALLVLTCMGVSFAHGSNDGQKGAGLMVLILLSLVPGAFALNLHTSSVPLHQLLMDAQTIAAIAPPHQSTFNLDVATAELSRFIQPTAAIDPSRTLSSLLTVNQAIAEQLSVHPDWQNWSPSDRVALRQSLDLLAASFSKLTQQQVLTDPAQLATIADYQTAIDRLTHFIPVGVKVAVALALGGGTLVGWKRIVVTVGEKIGQEQLTYAQGAAAQTVAMGTIAVASVWGLPVSTTHVLSSGIAGTMVATRSGLQFNTLRNLALAWILTFPVCAMLSGVIFVGLSHFMTTFNGTLR